MRPPDTYDVAIVGGGINGCGIAADAAGRGLSVVLMEKGDLAGATSSASSKLIHGGLRYLEYYEFRLVREALAEREVLLGKAPHIIWPLRFVLPHVPGLRARWMIRAGLFLYDHLYRRRAIPASRAVDLTRDPAGGPLRPELTRGFAYWDCWVDDARLVVLNARAAADRGASILTRTRVEAVTSEAGAWTVRYRNKGQEHEVRARSLVNAAGPWLERVDGMIAPRSNSPSSRNIRLVKGSHVVVPRIAGAEGAYLLQSADGRVVFALPFEDRFTLIGTTDIAYDGDPAEVRISSEEIGYLIDLAGSFFKVPLSRADVVWTYSGVRPLYDDNSANPSAVTRDYRLDLTTEAGRPPMLSVMGGKVTTYRRLAEEALERLRPYLPGMGPVWTASAPLPGGDMGPPTAGADRFDAFLARSIERWPGMPPAFLRALARRHGTRVEDVIGDARALADMGEDLGAGLTGREVAYFKDREWAEDADDILWRRTKTGLHMNDEQRQRAMEAITAQL